MKLYVYQVLLKCTFSDFGSDSRIKYSITSTGKKKL